VSAGKADLGGESIPKNLKNRGGSSGMGKSSDPPTSRGKKGGKGGLNDNYRPKSSSKTIKGSFQKSKGRRDCVTPSFSQGS